MPKTVHEAARRGRPPRSAEQADASRRSILDAARRLFSKEGYEGVSMRKIASIAQCSAATLYTLFPSKRHLLRHLWEEVFSDLAVEMDRAYGKGAAADRVQRLCETFIDFWLQRPDDYRAIFLIEDRLQGAHDRYFVDSSDALTRLDTLRRSIVEAQARHELRSGDPDEILKVLLCGVQGVALSLITIPEYPWGDPARLKRATVTALIAGLR